MHKKILSSFLSLCLCGGSLALALDNPGIPQPAKDAGDEASRRIAAETAAAIKELGRNPSTNKIAALVFKAVRSSPDSVLPIVDATVRVSPQSAVTTIITAVTAAVPNPWKQVIYRRLAALMAKKRAPDDDKSRPDGNQARDGRRYLDLGPKQPRLSIGLSAQEPSGPGTGDPGVNSANGIQMTLAEAIVRTAFDTEPGLSFSALQNAVNAALLMDPATLMRYIENPRAASGTGDAGLSNYANEPLRTLKQPTVSQ